MAATTKTLSAFKSRLSGGGARPNLFEVSIASFPSSIQDAWNADENESFKFLCKSATLPASNVANVDVPFRGRILKVAGDRTFDPWTVTVINDEDFKVRTAFEKWANVMSKLDDATGVSNPGSYMTDAEVSQLGRGASLNATTNDGGQSEVLRTYRFYDIFPTAITEIALSYDTGDTVETFDVTFQIQYFTIGASSGDTTIGQSSIN
tara:strand:- start:7172 stop:7792 length:621 start_codon:yes stop_codon:yes gene_type:complete